MTDTRFQGYLSRLFICAAVWIALSCQPHRIFHPSREDGKKTIPQSLQWPHDKSDLKPDPALSFGELPNGFRYVLMENSTPKHRVSMHLKIDAGSIQESDSQMGLAHFIEHMQFNGSTHFKSGELVKYFQRIGMEFGPDANAHTGFDETVYDLLLPDGSRKSLQDAFVVVKDFAEGALLLQTDVDDERRVVLAEKLARDSADYRTYVSTSGFEFQQTRLSKRYPIGDETVLKAADSKDLKAFYDTWYRPERMILIMVGDFDTPTARELIEEVFAPLSPRAPPRPEQDLGSPDHRGTKTFCHFEKEAGNARVSIEVLTNISPAIDTIAFEKQMLMRYLANRMVQYRLNTLIRKPDTPFTTASIGSGIYLREFDFAEITAECGPEKWGKSLTLIEQTLRKAIDFGFLDSEWNRAKKEFLSELDRAVSQASTRESPELAGQILSHINQGRVFMSPGQEKALYTPMVASITPKMVHETFKQLWQPDHRLVLLTGNAALSPSNIAPEKQVLSVYLSSSRTPVTRPDEMDSVDFPYLPDPVEEGTIIEQTDIQDLGIVRVTFSNGIRLNIKKTGFKSHEVLVHLSFGRGRSSEPGTAPGLALLSPAVINESGLGSLTKDELERAFSGKTISLIFGIGEDEFYFRGSTVSEEIRLMFQLLYAYIRDPGFRRDAYDLSMERFMQRYESLARSVDGAVPLYGERFLAGGDSRFGVPPASEFKQLSLEQVRSWVENALHRSDMELSVVGDLDTDQIIRLASGYLGTLPEKKGMDTKTVNGIPVFPVARSLTIEVPTEIPKAIIAVAYPTDDIWDIQKTRRLSVLSEVFSEKLRVTIREKLGASYSPFAVNIPSRAYSGFGFIQAIAYLAPGDADRIIGEVKQIAADLAENGVDEDALIQALDPMLTGIKGQLRENDYWLNTVLSGSCRYDEQIGWSRSILSDYGSITKEELSTLAARYLDNGKAATIKIVPKKGPISKENPQDQPN